MNEDLCVGLNIYRGSFIVALCVIWSGCPFSA